MSFKRFSFKPSLQMLFQAKMIKRFCFLVLSCIHKMMLMWVWNNMLKLFFSVRFVLLSLLLLVAGTAPETPQEVVTRYNNYKAICNGLGYENLGCKGKKEMIYTYFNVYYRICKIKYKSYLLILTGNHKQFFKNFDCLENQCFICIF